MSYHFNPHSHIKVWLSNNPDVFMNFENQTRMIEMRENNPDDPIYLVYDSSLLNTQAIQELMEYCSENSITPIDADSEDFRSQLTTKNENKLYDFYKDEITHLKEGGNLGVASDILRWLPPCFRLGSYTDLDVPLDTSQFSEAVPVDAPILINVGSLKLMGRKEMLIALNEFIAVVDESKARELIDKVHAGMVSKLEHFDSDYIEKTEQTFQNDGFLNRYLVGYMKNRTESLYIQKSNDIDLDNDVRSSRGLRHYINDIMTDQVKYLDFHKLNESETHQEVIQRLRTDLKSQLSWIKWLFFTSEYNEIKKLLSLDDEKFVKAMMKKERTLYLKSIVICTTGPVELARSFFGDYMVDGKDIDHTVRPYTMSHYKLDKAFLSNNVIPLHENAWGMLRYLGASVGEKNDSSWLEEGQKLQQTRLEKLLEQQKELISSLPETLLKYKQDIEAHTQKLEKDDKGWFAFIFRGRRHAKINALKAVLNCFNTQDNTLDLKLLKKVMTEEVLPNKSSVFSGFFSHKTQDLIEGLNQVCRQSLILRAIRTKTPSYEKPQVSESSQQMNGLFGSPTAEEEAVKTSPSHKGEKPVFTSPNVSSLSSFTPSPQLTDDTHASKLDSPIGMTC